MSGRHEFPDPTPLHVPIGFRRPPSLTEMIQRYVRIELSEQAAAKHQAETFEEADDFLVDDDPELLSPYEITADQELFDLRADSPAAPAVPAAAAGSTPAAPPSPPEVSSPTPP